MSDPTGASALFSTVLVARMPHTNPSELELQMRKLSKRIRVVEKLSGGAHLLLPSESSIAVRTYYPSDLQKLNKAVDWKAKFAAWNHDGLQLGEDPENLAGFRDSFQFPFVFFVLPSFQSTAENIDHAGSFLHQAQIIMNGWSRSNTTKSNIFGRTFLVPDASSIIETLVQLSVNLKPEKRALKDQYFEQMKTKYFIPHHDTNIPPSLDAASKHVKHEFLKWAEIYELPAGEADVLVFHLGTLGAITSASHVVLENVPVDDDTKQLFHNFFGSEGSHEMEDKLVKTDYQYIPQGQDAEPIMNTTDLLPQPTQFKNVPSQILCDPYPQQHSPMNSDYYSAEYGMHPRYEHSRRQYQQQQFPAIDSALNFTRQMLNEQPIMSHPPQHSQSTTYHQQRSSPFSTGIHHNHPYSGRSVIAPPRYY